MIAPSFIAARCWRSITFRSPVTVMKMSAYRRRLDHRHHLEAVHQRFERADRIDLGDDDVSAHALARIATPRPHQP